MGRGKREEGRGNGEEAENLKIQNSKFIP